MSQGVASGLMPREMMIMRIEGIEDLLEIGYEGKLYIFNINLKSSIL